MMVARTLVALVVVAGSVVLADGAEAPKPSLIPWPEKMEVGGGVFTIGAETAIVVDGDARGEGEYLAEFLGTPTGFDFEVRESSGREGCGDFFFQDTASAEIYTGALGYELTVS